MWAPAPEADGRIYAKYAREPPAPSPRGGRIAESFGAVKACARGGRLTKPDIAPRRADTPSDGRKVGRMVGNAPLLHTKIPYPLGL
jgi:hypothetical protein